MSHVVGAVQQARPTGAGAQPGESVLSRAVRILEAFTPVEPALRVTDIARLADLHVATASRLVAELVGHGLLERRRDGRVRIGNRLWELAYRSSAALSLRELAMPFLEDAHAVLGQHVQLGVLDRGEVLFIERLSAPDSVISYTRVAGRLPLHASSCGLVLLASAPTGTQERVLSGRLERFTARTVTEPDRLRALLADVRRQGFALCPGCIHEDAAGVAVPVRGPDDTVVAGLSAIVPNDGQAYAHLPVLTAAARGIGRALRAARAAELRPR